MLNAYAINDEAASSWGAMPPLTESIVTSMAKRKPFRKIKLTQGKFAIVDAEDYQRVAQYNWQYYKQKLVNHEEYGRAARGIRNKKTQKMECIFMHRFILNAPKNKHVDHINHNGLDNRRANIRLCTRSQNIYNMRPRGKTSRFKGVRKEPGYNLWFAYVGCEGKRHYLGCFKNEIAAAIAYNKAARKLQGEFAWLNKIPRRKS